MKILHIERAHGEDVPDLKISVRYGGDGGNVFPDNLGELRDFFMREAERMYSAMKKSMPGGTIDALFAVLAREKSSLFVIPHMNETEWSANDIIAQGKKIKIEISADDAERIRAKYESRLAEGSDMISQRMRLLEEGTISAIIHERPVQGQIKLADDYIRDLIRPAIEKAYENIFLTHQKLLTHIEDHLLSDLIYLEITADQIETIYLEYNAATRELTGRIDLCRPVSNREAAAYGKLVIYPIIRIGKNKNLRLFSGWCADPDPDEDLDVEDARLKAK